MIAGIDSSTSSINQSLMMPKQQENYVMTDEEKEQVYSIISKYNTEEMSEEDTQSLLEEIQAPGVKPGDDLMGILEESGVEMPEPPQKGSMPPTPEDESKEITTNEDMPSYLNEFISKAQSGEISDEEVSTIINTLQQNGYTANGNIFDNIA